MGGSYDEVDLEDMDWNAEMGVTHQPEIITPEPMNP